MLHFLTFEYMSKDKIVAFGAPPVNEFQMLKSLLEKSDDEVVFIITTNQQDWFDIIMTQYDLKKYITFKQKNYITNPNYLSSGRRLKLFILKGKGKHYEN